MLGGGKTGANTIEVAWTPPVKEELSFSLDCCISCFFLLHGLDQGWWMLDGDILPESHWQEEPKEVVRQASPVPRWMLELSFWNMNSNSKCQVRQLAGSDKKNQEILVDFGGKICMVFNPGLGVSLLWGSQFPQRFHFGNLEMMPCMRIRGAWPCGPWPSARKPRADWRQWQDRIDTRMIQIF